MIAPMRIGIKLFLKISDDAVVNEEPGLLVSYRIERLLLSNYVQVLSTQEFRQHILPGG
jgi:hypothetical protein